MRTSVYPNPPNNDDPEDTDEFPECSGAVQDGGALVIVNEDDSIETTYEPGEWISFSTYAED